MGIVKVFREFWKLTGIIKILRDFFKVTWNFVNLPNFVEI